MGDFYNGNKLLSLLDINGKKPEIYMCCGNRTAGKTFFFKRWMLRRFVKHGEKFVVFVRYIDAESGLMVAGARLCDYLRCDLTRFLIAVGTVTGEFRGFFVKHALLA